MMQGLNGVCHQAAFVDFVTADDHDDVRSTAVVNTGRGVSWLVNANSVATSKGAPRCYGRFGQLAGCNTRCSISFSCRRKFLSARLSP